MSNSNNKLLYFDVAPADVKINGGELSIEQLREIASMELDDVKEKYECPNMLAAKRLLQKSKESVAYFEGSDVFRENRCEISREIEVIDKELSNLKKEKDFLNSTIEVLADMELKKIKENK